MTHSVPAFPSPHSHVFLGADHARNERRTWLVIGLTAAMMVGEIAAGTVFGSMALVADGWHMSTHAAAMTISALAYLFARRFAEDTRFTFGTGKLGDLAAFASAVILALVALLIGVESLLRFANPQPISFSSAIDVAVLGLGVNLVCAWLLRDDQEHHHGHGHDHGAANAVHAAHTHDHGDNAHDHAGQSHSHGSETAKRPGARDNNLRAAYLHVLADALTSVLAIGALVIGSIYGWVWLDPAIGIVGALIIARWSWGLIKGSGAVLLDFADADEPLDRSIRASIEIAGDRITDLHLWQLGPGHHGAIVSLTTANPRSPAYYRRRLAHLRELSHVTVEVEPTAGPRG